MWCHLGWGEGPFRTHCQAALPGIMEGRRGMGGVNVTKDNSTMVDKQVKILEKRLCQAPVGCRGGGGGNWAFVVYFFCCGLPEGNGKIRNVRLGFVHPIPLRAEGGGVAIAWSPRTAR